MIDEAKTTDDFQPSPYVLRRYAEDMETNTRLIDGDIAPYLRKVARWIEAYLNAARTPAAEHSVSVSLKTTLFNINEGFGDISDHMTNEQVIQEVLDAAGVKYVD